MPTRSEHEAKVTENDKFISFIKAKRSDTDDYNSWVAVVLFYKIVHFTEALLAEAGEHSASHTERETFLTNKVVLPNRGKNDYKNLWKYYASAKYLCNRSRYCCMYPTCQEIETENECVTQYIRIASCLLPKHIKPGCIAESK